MDGDPGRDFGDLVFEMGHMAVVVLVILTIYLGISPADITELIASYYDQAGMAFLGAP